MFAHVETNHDLALCCFHSTVNVPVANSAPPTTSSAPVCSESPVNARKRCQITEKCTQTHNKTDWVSTGHWKRQKKSDINAKTLLLLKLLLLLILLLLILLYMYYARFNQWVIHPVPWIFRLWVWSHKECEGECIFLFQQLSVSPLAAFLRMIVSSKNTHHTPSHYNGL